MKYEPDYSPVQVANPTVAVTFEVDGWGRIEIKRNTDKGDWSGVAYFLEQDYEAEIDTRGEFTNMFGTKFRVLFPTHKSKTIILQISLFREVGCITVE